MGKRYYALLFATCTLSALIGVLAGYFVIGPVGVSALEGAVEIADEYVNEEAQATEEIFETDEIEHRYIVTSEDGFIVVYCNEFGKDITSTAVNALPAEEQERLAKGIFLYSEEALVRILEDYGS